MEICIAKTFDAESLTFYNKTKADNFRYLCEFEEDEELKKVLLKANEYYSKAKEESKGLKTSHPIRLGLSLNYSVFKYEIEENVEAALSISKLAFESAILEL